MRMQHYPNSRANGLARRLSRRLRPHRTALKQSGEDDDESYVRVVRPERACSLRLEAVASETDLASGSGT